MITIQSVSQRHDTTPQETHLTCAKSQTVDMVYISQRAAPRLLIEGLTHLVNKAVDHVIAQDEIVFGLSQLREGRFTGGVDRALSLQEFYLLTAHVSCGNPNPPPPNIYIYIYIICIYAYQYPLPVANKVNTTN